jgi:large subunit ribosomal protein L19
MSGVLFLQIIFLFFTKITTSQINRICPSFIFNFFKKKLKMKEKKVKKIFEFVLDFEFKIQYQTVTFMTKLQQLVQTIQAGTIKTELPDVRVGDLVRIDVSIQEGNKQRVQPFEGTVIAKHHAGANSTLTVRKSLQGVGVERVFPLYAPCVANVQILRRAQVSRAKLYYLRTRTGKATRLKEKFEALPEIWVNQ